IRRKRYATAHSRSIPTSSRSMSRPSAPAAEHGLPSTGYVAKPSPASPLGRAMSDNHHDSSGRQRHDERFNFQPMTPIDVVKTLYDGHENGQRREQQKIPQVWSCHASQADQACEDQQ